MGTIVTEHKLEYWVGTAGMAHLEPRGTSHWYCTCARWQHVRDKTFPITAKRMTTVVNRHIKHIKETAKT